MHESSANITIRPLGDRDRAAIARLAALDSSQALGGALLGAEVGGRLIAAVSLRDGESIADPFRPSGQVRALLELRAAQLRRGAARPRSRRIRLGAARRARGALAGSPPGAGGRLLTLSAARGAPSSAPPP
jgi:hypothetical protein